MRTNQVQTSQLGMGMRVLEWILSRWFVPRWQHEIAVQYLESMLRLERVKREIAVAELRDLAATSADADRVYQQLRRVS